MKSLLNVVVGLVLMIGLAAGSYLVLWTAGRIAT